MAAYQKVLVEIASGIATLTLNRPDKLNALDLDLCQDLTSALSMTSTSEAVRVIILTGAGRGFCAGADLAILESEGTALVAAGKTIASLIRSAPKPVLAAVNGAAAGGGANLALACDYRVASVDAKIGQVFNKLGLGPDWGGSFFLPRLASVSRSLELLWSARMVAASEARELGLFDEVVPADGLAARARELATVWASHPALAVRRSKEGIYSSEDRSLAEMLEWEEVQQHELFATAEARQRIRQSLTRSR